MNAYAYEISIYYTDREITIKTNDIYCALSAVREAFNNDAERFECISGYTGEVLMYKNSDGIYWSPEFWLMWIGFMI